MKIVDNMTRTVDVNDLKSGEIFLRNGDFYLKLASNYYIYKSLRSERGRKMLNDIARTLNTRNRESAVTIIESYTGSYNAVNLKTNSLVQVCGLVTLVDGELVLNGLK